MKSKARWGLAALAMVACSAAVCLYIRTFPHDSTFEGRSPGESLIVRKDSRESRRTEKLGAEELRLMGTNAVPYLLREWLRHDGDQVFDILGAFAALNPEAVPLLIAKAQGNGSERTAAIEILGWLRSKEAIPLLLAGVKDGDSHTRREALWSLGMIEAEPDTVVPVLIELLNGPDPLLRVSAAEALRRFGPKALDAVEALKGFYS